MTDTITLSRTQVSEIVKALDGIGELMATVRFASMPSLQIPGRSVCTTAWDTGMPGS